MSSPVLCTWDYVVPEDAPATALQAWIPPDGCQDWIGVALPGGPVHWHLFALAGHAALVTLTPGTRMRGYRLHPGMQVNHTLLHQCRPSYALDDEASVQALIEDAVLCDHRVQDALGALSQAHSVRHAAQELGVSVRTLQRLILQATAQSPKFWHSLARVRQACRSLPGARTLADVAAMHGFADQPHMNLEFQHWLGCTPGQLRTDAQRLPLLHAEGYG